MNVLGLCSYPIEAAATRYRLAQYVAPLLKKGINLEISPFLDSASFSSLYQKQRLSRKIIGVGLSFLKRLHEVVTIREYDLIYVQREAMLFGPAFFEWLYQRIGNIPFILDLDDSTYVSYVSPTYGKLGSFLKCFGKTDALIRRADAVICGNRFIAEYVEKRGGTAIVIPTVVDTAVFSPVEKENKIPILGWVGTHSTFPFLQSIFPVLEKLACDFEFVLKIVGAGIEKVEVNNLTVENLTWELEREVEDFQSLDIGLYPMATPDSSMNDWILGKSGFKAIQYMAVGVPFVVTPIGVCSEIGKADITHFVATTEAEWYNSLYKLLSDVQLCKMMGRAGREYSMENFTVEKQVEVLANTIQGITRR